MKLICWDCILPKIMIDANYDAQLKKRWRFGFSNAFLLMSIYKSNQSPET